MRKAEKNLGVSAVKHGPGGLLRQDCEGQGAGLYSQNSHFFNLCSGWTIVNL